MIEDALAGKIDRIVTKSVSRFARNTVDTLTTIRKLKDKGVGVFFEKENIDTLDSKGELLITIMSSLAQEESRSISENVTWGWRKRIADGKVTVAYSHFLGYEKGEDGTMQIVEDEAKIVRQIYGMFLDGKTPSGIAARLSRQGIPSPAGKEKWQSSTVKSILTNEKYKGDALLQKTFTVDFLQKKKKANEGEVPQYYVENSHPAIVTEEVFDLVQHELRRRQQKGRHTSASSMFSNRIVCGECGAYYGSKVWHSTDAYRSRIWRCNRKYAWVPLCAFLSGIVLCALSFANTYTFHKMPECFCLTFAAFWESCLQVGLIPTNGYYRYFFSESTVAAQIVDGQGRPVYRAQNAPDLTAGQLDAAAREAILLNADTRLQSAPVQDGRVYWVEDISKINRIQGQLAEINARLSEENELIQAENELKRQRAQIEEKNRLMDEMIALVQPQLLQINRLLEEENAQALNVQNLKQVCLLGAYVKRRVNLALICDQKTVVPVDELAHCIRESLTYLTQYGAVCALHQEGKGSVSSRDVQTAYDFFEDCLEAALPSLSALMVRVECSERFSIRLMMEDAAGLPKADKYRALGKLTIDDADGALCATLSPDWGGVRA